MIRCEPAAEPGHFDELVRQRGRRWLATHTGGRPKDYWRAVKDDVERAFHQRCAYSAMHIAPHGTVDHFVAGRELLYEWRNYRYSAGRINSAKQNVPAERLLDPCEIEDGWFELLLPSLQVTVGAGCPEALRERAAYTIRRLGLDGEGLKRVRAENLRLFRERQLSLAVLDARDPLLARAIRGERAADGV